MDNVGKEAERRAIVLGLSSIAALAVTACPHNGGPAESPQEEAGEEKGEEGEQAEVTPGEDLMQEHGVLERILLVYDEAMLRLDGSRPLDPAIIVGSAQIVRRFVEDYHEKLEEQFLFPRLEKLGKERELVATLKAQHEKGRQLTDAILATALAKTGVDATTLSAQLRSFVRMYRPHASREETVLFPAFRKMLDKDSYHELGERFEEREHELFGENGFDDFVAQLAKIETALEIHDLAMFTPR